MHFLHGSFAQLLGLSVLMEQTMLPISSREADAAFWCITSTSLLDFAGPCARLFFAQAIPPYDRAERSA